MGRIDQPLGEQQLGRVDIGRKLGGAAGEQNAQRRAGRRSPSACRSGRVPAGGFRSAWRRRWPRWKSSAAARERASGAAFSCADSFSRSSPIGVVEQLAELLDLGLDDVVLGVPAFARPPGRQAARRARAWRRRRLAGGSSRAAGSRRTCDRGSGRSRPSGRGTTAPTASVISVSTSLRLKATSVLPALRRTGPGGESPRRCGRRIRRRLRRQLVAGELLEDEPVEGLVGVEALDDVVAKPPGPGPVPVVFKAFGLRIAGHVEPMLAPLLRHSAGWPAADRPAARRRRGLDRSRNAAMSSGVGGRPIRLKYSAADQRPPVGLRRGSQLGLLQPSEDEGIDRIGWPGSVGGRGNRRPAPRLQRPVGTLVGGVGVVVVAGAGGWDEQDQCG